MRFSPLWMFSVMCLAGAAQADTYKCISADGKVSFASTPCPTYVGDSTRVRPPPSRLSSDWEERDFPHRLNQNATDILKISRRSKLIITNEKEISDHMQAIRPPPPGVPSVCVAPDYNDACFDPSGGRVRQPAKGNNLFKSGGN
ncbi:DUF4124 domain-containing protein [Pseudomonas sp. NPDC090202]|uniref:DUF4124 domain-containing protein n=1 Tax=unclassified Pseudomonas TaxID=196821 RepID=UPI00381FF334